MPVVIARPKPIPLPSQPSRARALVVQGAAPPTLAQLFGTWNFTVRVYIAFDGPLTPYPTWIEITPWVETDRSTITIRRGRADGLADVNAGTCTITVDNSDGRFTASNPGGAWYGRIKKGAWLRVDLLPLSGIVSTRFVGFITSLPVKWNGQYSTSQISASDRFVLLTQARALTTFMADRMIADPNGAPYLLGYWALHEAQVGANGTQYVLDSSGRTPAGQQQLSVRSIGVPSGTGIQFSATPAPGFDGVSAVKFSPAGNNVGGTGALSVGSYLVGNLGSLGTSWEATIWINTTVVNQPVWATVDPMSNYAFGVQLDSNGLLLLWQSALTHGNANVFQMTMGPLSDYSLADGQWHQIAVLVQTTNAPNGPGKPYAFVQIDGGDSVGQFIGNLNVGAGFCPPVTLSQFQLGAVYGWPSQPAVSAPSFFSGSLSDLSIHLVTGQTVPDTNSPYIDATTDTVGTDCGLQVIHLALRCRNLPVPTNATFTLRNTGAVVVYDNYGTTPFLNIPAPTAHPVGAQATAGKNVLDAMRECAHTENMPLFIDRQGRLTLQPSTIRQNPSPAWIIDAADLDSSTGFADDFQYTINETVVTPSGGSGLTVDINGLASQAKYGVYSTSISTVSLNIVEATSLGAAVNFAGADPPPRPAIVCEVATLAGQPTPPNLLANADSTFLAGLGDWANPGAPIVAPVAGVADPTMPCAGVVPPLAQSLRVTYPANPNSGLSIQSGYQLAVPTINGQQYTASAWVYLPPGAVVNAGIKFGSNPAVTTAVQGAWTRIFTTITATGSSTTLTIGTGSQPTVTGTAGWFGAVQVQPGGAATPYETPIGYGAAWYDAVLAADISTPFEVVNWPAQAPSSAASYYVEGYTETIGAGQHTFAWNTSPAQGPTYQCDSPTLGLIDTPGLTLAY